MTVSVNPRNTKPNGHLATAIIEVHSLPQLSSPLVTSTSPHTTPRHRHHRLAVTNHIPLRHIRFSAPVQTPAPAQHSRHSRVSLDPTRPHHLTPPQPASHSASCTARGMSDHCRVQRVLSAAISTQTNVARCGALRRSRRIPVAPRQMSVLAD